MDFTTFTDNDILNILSCILHYLICKYDNTEYLYRLICIISKINYHPNFEKMTYIIYSKYKNKYPDVDIGCLFSNFNSKLAKEWNKLIYGERERIKNEVDIVSENPINFSNYLEDMIEKISPPFKFKVLRS